MADRKVNIVLKAKDEATKVFQNVANNTLPQFAKRIAQGLTAFTSVAAVEEVVRRSVGAALEAEKATAGLAAALRAQGNNAEASLPALKNHAEALSRMALADDEAVQGAQKVLVSVGGLLGPKLDEATKAALDLAAGLGIDLEQAATMIAKSAKGSTKEFSRLGFEFRKNATDAEKLDAVLAGVQTRFGGMAAAQIATASGQLHELNEAFGELLETLGTQFIGGAANLGLLTKALQDLNDEANKPGAAGFGASLGAIFAAIAANQIGADVLGGFNALRVVLGLIGIDAEQARKKEKELIDASAAITNFEDPFGAWAGMAADNTKRLTAEFAKQEELAAKHAKELEDLLSGARIANFVPGVSKFDLSPFEKQKIEVQKQIRQMQELKKQSEATFADVGLGALGIENLGPENLDAETDAAKRLAAALDAAKAAGDALFADVGLGALGIENLGPVQPPEDREAFDRALRQTAALRDATVALNAPTLSVASSWAQVFSAIERAAGAMPDTSSEAVAKIRSLLETAKNQAEVSTATGPGAADLATREQASLDALATLDAAIQEISYLTPEQREQLKELSKTLIGVGRDAQSMGATIKASLEGAVLNAAVQLGDTLVDAAFGAKVSWADAIEEILKGLIKAVVQALILRLVTTALGLSGGGTVPSGTSAMMAGGGVAAPEYLAGGTSIFRPRGTDTVPAMLTPGEIVLPRNVSRALLGGRIVIGQWSGARGGGESIIGGRLSAFPANEKSPAMFADGGFVSPMITPSVPNMSSSGAPARIVNLTVTAVDKRGIRELLIEHSDALGEALDYIEARGA